MRLERGQRLVVATHNKGKLAEFEALLMPYGLQLLSAAALSLPEPEETAETFVGNAELKAHAAATASGLTALADDSGLSVDDLDGAPGIYSARWAGEPRDFYAGMDRIRRELEGRGVPPEGAGAEFVCVLSLCSPDGEVQSFEGRVRGKLTFPPRGTTGFGYDPIFIPDGHTITFGEMQPAFKDSISHRAKAFAQFAAAVLF
jgi:XTP/dITP diphosphohydrolase